MTILDRARQTNGDKKRSKKLQEYWKAVHRIMKRGHCPLHIARWMHSVEKEKSERRHLLMKKGAGKA